MDVFSLALLCHSGAQTAAADTQPASARSLHGEGE
jgi:hypothetical protein